MATAYNTAMCRCCHMKGEFRSLDSSHILDQKSERFSTLLRDSLNIKIAPKHGFSNAICEECINELVNATKFRRQVLRCEEMMREWLGSESFCGYELNKDPVIKEEFHKNYDIEDNSYFIPECSLSKSEIKEENEIITIEVPSLKETIVNDGVNDSEDWRHDSDDETLQEIKEKSKPYNCDLCPKKFKYKGSLVEYREPSLETHTKSHTNSKVYVCVLCETKCSKSKELTKHIEEKHELNGKYPCNKCMESYKTGKELKIHLNIHKNAYKCNECQKEFKKKIGLQNHLIVHTKEKKFSCSVCAKSFGHKQTLKDHELIHKGIKPHICDICGRSFHQRTHLSRHISMVHKKEKYPCNLCNKLFTSKSYLSIHERTHSGLKPFSCEVCRKPFAAYTTLKVHLRLHTGVKPYTCNLCQRKFAQLSSFKLHERSHSGEKPYQCFVCKKAFSDNGYLKIHLRIHDNVKPYECNVCKKHFRESGQLKRHMSVHLGVKPYSCKICNKNISNLSKHMKVHAIKDLHCSVCNKKFDVKVDLENHRKSHNVDGRVYECNVCKYRFAQVGSLKKHKCCYSEGEKMLGSLAE